jgi:hypothetical protein
VTGQKRAQEVEQRSVGNGVIGRKAATLRHLEAVSERLGLDLSHQAGFADPGFAGKQGDLPSAMLRLIDQLLERGEVTDAVDEDGADHRLLRGYRHAVPCLLMMSRTMLHRASSTYQMKRWCGRSPGGSIPLYYST